MNEIENGLMCCRVCGGGVRVLTDRLRRGKGTVYYCPSCDYGMLRPSFANYEEYYDEEYRKKFNDIIEQTEEKPELIFKMNKEFHCDRVDIISEYFNMDKSFLEIGCSAGQFLTHIVDHFGRVEGVELSTSCGEFVKKNLGVKVHTCSIEKLKLTPFDYIGFFQVFEHVEDPVAFLSVVRDNLMDDGKLFIEVPNLYDPLRSLWNVPAYEDFYYHEAHLSYFSEKSFRIVAEKAGFNIERVVYLQDYNLLNNLYWYFNNAPQSSSEFGLRPPYIQFKNSDMSKLAAEEVNNLLDETNKKYFEILAKNGLTSNIFFVLSKNTL